MSIDYVRRLFGLDGQSAVVIGGSGMLGGAICEGLGRAGSALVIAGRSASRGHKRVEVVRALSGTAGFRYVDVLERESIEQLLEYALGEHGQVDILVNCVSASGRTGGDPDAGRAEQLGTTGSEELPGPGETGASWWDEVMNVQVRGPSWATEIFATQMARQTHGGSILNVVSPPCPVAYSPLRNQAEDQGQRPTGSRGQRSARRRATRETLQLAAASQAALLQLTREAAADWKSHGVRINGLCVPPFPARPPEKRGAEEQPVDLEGTRTARGRPAVLEDLIGAMLLLVSRRAGAMITGAELRLESGEFGQAGMG